MTATALSSLETMTDPELLSLAIKLSGRSVRQFARDNLTRDPRTVQRWLAGDNLLPKAVRDYCTRLILDAQFVEGVKERSGGMLIVTDIESPKPEQP